MTCSRSASSVLRMPAKEVNDGRLHQYVPSPSNCSRWIHASSMAAGLGPNSVRTARWLLGLVRPVGVLVGLEVGAVRHPVAQRAVVARRHLRRVVLVGDVHQRVAHHRQQRGELRRRRRVESAACRSPSPGRTRTGRWWRWRLPRTGRTSPCPACSCGASAAAGESAPCARTAPADRAPRCPVVGTVTWHTAVVLESTSRRERRQASLMRVVQVVQRLLVGDHRNGSTWSSTSRRNSSMMSPPSCLLPGCLLVPDR
jgi:hypothetical protein